MRKLTIVVHCIQVGRSLHVEVGNYAASVFAFAYHV